MKDQIGLDIKKKFLLLVFYAITTLVKGQQLYLEGGKILTSFEFQDSQNNRLENLLPTGNTYMATGFRSHLFTENLHFLLGANYINYGSIASDDMFGNYMEWNTTYLGLNVGLDLNLLKIGKAAFYLKGDFSSAIFVQGSQIHNNRVIDLNDDEDFDVNLSTLKIGFGFLHPISDNLSCYAQYIYGKSMDMGHGDTSLKFKTSAVGFGFMIDISRRQELANVSKERIVN